MARRVIAGAALLLCLGVATAAAADGCVNTLTGYSGTFGRRASGRLDRFSNQTAVWRAKGDVTRVSLYYSPSARCVQGVKVFYGPNPMDARLLGQDGPGLEARDLALEAGEVINKAQIKAGSCVEMLRLSTSAGRVVELGDRESATQVITSYPNRPTGFLAAVRGYEEYSKAANGALSRGPLRTLQLAWANCNAAAAPPADASAMPAARLESAKVAEAQAAARAPVTCPAVADMCSADATASAAAHCPALSPFTKSSCLGGCCVSSGKCSSSSCAISGLGKEVSNTICYGLNPGVSVGASPNCRGLACKLSISGCTSDLLGGSCVGTVVDLSGDAAKSNPAGNKLVGYPCLDVTPSDKTLHADGTMSTSGEYVAKLWSVCDCRAPGAVTREGLLAFPKVGKLNVTDVKSLVDALKPSNGSHVVSGVLDAIRTKVPALIVPEGEAPANLTKALGVIGSLVQGRLEKAAASGDANGALANFAKGAAAVAAASNSSNPLGSLLGAMAPKHGNKTNPLAGLGNLVNAMAPEDATPVQKADVLASLLTQLASGSTAAPQAELVGAVSKMLAANNGTAAAATAAELNAAIADFRAGKTSDAVKAVVAAANQGKDAAVGQVDLAGIIAKAKDYVAKNGDNPTLHQMLTGAQLVAQGRKDGKNYLGWMQGLAADAKNGSVTLQSLVDAAGKLAPALQQAAGQSAVPAGSGSMPQLSALLNAARNTEAGKNIDVQALAGLAQKMGPLLQALGSGASGAPGGDPVQKLLSAVGLNEGTSTALSNVNWSGLSEAAQKAGPVLQALSKAGGGSGNGLQGLQSFLDRMAKARTGVAAASIPEAAPAAATKAPAATA